MDSPALEWILTGTSTRILDLLNTMSAAMPLATWRLRSLVRARQRLAITLGMGQLQLTGTMPSGHQAVFEILDPAEYERTRPQAAAAA